MNRVPMTLRGAELLRQELQQLKSVERPNVIVAIAEARAQGDLSENAEYESARERQGFIEGRIKEIESKLSVAQIIDPKALNSNGRCVFGATVDLLDINTQLSVTYQIVGDDEANIQENRISINSPIARAVIGKQEGDEVSVETPSGIREFELVKVRYS